VGVDDLFETWDLENSQPQSVGRAESIFQFTMEVFFSYDADGTAPPAVLPLFPLSTLQQSELTSEAFHHMLYEKVICLTLLFLFYIF
jgi:hypothetical protein